MLSTGIHAPNFTLMDDSNKEVTLSSFLGKKVVLYFYPRDNTPGCTTEACQFRDAYDEFLACGAVVIGISPDSAKSHGSFREKFNLPFYLLADPDKEVIKLYDTLKEKNMYGKAYLGVERSTYLIDEYGTISAVFPKVKADGHAEEILRLLKV